MMKRFHILLLLALLMLLALCGHALADGALSAEGVITVHSIADEREIRNTGATSVSMDGLGSGEYYSFSFRVRNSSYSDVQIKSAYARIDGGEKLGWGSVTLGSGQSVTYHIYYNNMSKLSPGTYKVDFYANDSLLASQYFTIAKNWRSAISLPSAAEMNAYSTSSRSPYIVCIPEFSGVSGYTEYAVDFKVDYAPKGTYLSVCNWYFDMSSMKKQYKSVEIEAISGYCGFQVLSDGTRVAILSLWDVFCTDKAGNRTTIRAKRLYPERGLFGDTFDGEGTGAHTLVKYNWEDGHPYRALVQLGTNSANGHTTVIFWACDLLTGAWTRLIEYDTGLTGVYMNWSCAFLEDFDTSTAGQLRTMELSNIRAYSTRGQWVTAKSATMEQNYEHPGSYDYGSDGSAFWAVTTGLPGRLRSPGRQRYSVSRYETGIPY